MDAAHPYLPPNVTAVRSPVVTTPHLFVFKNLMKKKSFPRAKAKSFKQNGNTWDLVSEMTAVLNRRKQLTLFRQFLTSGIRPNLPAQSPPVAFHL